MEHKIVCVRFNSEELTLMRKVSKTRGEDVSSFIRRAVKKELVSLGFYNEKTKRTLGISEELKE